MEGFRSCAVGLLWRNAFRHGHWHDWRRPDTTRLHGVGFLLSADLYRHVLTIGLRKYGIDGLSKSAQADLSANIASTLQAGCFFGALIASWIADKLGRRTALMIAAGVTICGVVIQAASSGSVSCMYVGRLVAGLGVGAASMIVPLYISESAPRAIRGGLTGIYQVI